MDPTITSLSEGTFFMNTRRLVLASAVTSLVLLSVVTSSEGAFGGQTGQRAGVDAKSSSSSTITIAESSSPATLDPQATPLIQDNAELALSYQCLMQTSASGVLQPALATGYSVSANRSDLHVHASSQRSLPERATSDVRGRCVQLSPVI